MSDYRPIACAAYDVFEIACLRGQRLRLRWRPDNPSVSTAAPAGEEPPGVVEEIVEPLGLTTRDGAEWLSARGAARRALTLRLDWIVEAEPLP